MGLGHSPRIVTDGLVLCLDAGNRRSFTSGDSYWKDLSKSALAGGLNNSPTFDENNGGGLIFDGTDDYIQMPSTSKLNMAQYGSVSVSMFCKSNHTSSTGWNTYWAGVSKYSHFILGPNGFGGKMVFLVYTNNNWRPTNYTADIWGQSNIDIREYHLYTGTYNGNTGVSSLYVDDSLEYSAVVGSQYLFSNHTTAFEIGKRDISNHFLNATINIVSIYGKALTADEIRQNYLATKERYA